MNIRKLFDMSVVNSNREILLAVTGYNYLRIKEVDGRLRLTDTDMNPNEIYNIDETQDHSKIVAKWRKGLNK